MITLTLTPEAAALVERTLHEAADALVGPMGSQAHADFITLTEVCYALLVLAADAGVEFPEY